MSYKLQMRRHTQTRGRDVSSKTVITRYMWNKIISAAEIISATLNVLENIRELQ